MTSRRIRLYDTTLRDGTQREGLSLSVEDKLRIARELDAFGVHYIEGGWPGSNPKDAEFFQRARKLQLRHAKIAAFGSTRHATAACDTDANIAALVAAETPVVTLVGKSSVLHVERVLETSPEENVRMISESVAYLKGLGKEVIYDAEHFFDGFELDPDYALATLAAAAEAGAECAVLCDTNGGTLPDAVAEMVRTVGSYFSARSARPELGVHTHNDSGLAVANAMAAVRAGATHVQGTINGYGERCGNMDLIPVIANLQIKLGYECIPEDQLRRLTEVSHLVADIANLNPDAHAPYVGRSAFAHKGGIHVAAVHKEPSSYEHVAPARVGNETRVVVSELAGRKNVQMRAEALGLELEGGERALLQQIKVLESNGYQFEAADGSFEMLVRRSASDYDPPFQLLDYTAFVSKQGDGSPRAQAMVRLRVGDEVMHTAADGNGPVHALDRAIRKALIPYYPELGEVHLADYKVRIIDAHLGPAARPRVLMESARGDERWSTVGCDEDIIEASWQALWDSLELPLLRDRDARRAEAPPSGQREDDPVKPETIFAPIEA
ncbi:MAG TPA: citramalate synthase [Longimicrobiaceae bacterium]|nr:citramalate synthase [Longimicrobiaceae bacterium]